MVARFILRGLTLLVLTAVLSACSGLDSPPPGTTTSTEPATPRLAIAPSSIDEGDVGTVGMEFTLFLSSAVNNDVVVEFSTLDGNAFSGTDYEATSGTLVIPAGQESGTFIIPVLGDTVLEVDEVFRLSLTARIDDLEQTALGSTEVIGTIINDDNNLPVAVEDILSVLVDSGLTSVNVIVNDTDDPGDILTLTAVNTNGSGSVTINVDKVSVDYTPGIGFFGTEAVTYTVSDDNGGSDTSGSLTVTVIRPELKVLSAFATEGDAGTVPLVFIAILNSPLLGAVTADYATSDGTATVLDNDYVAVSNGRFTIEAGNTTATFLVTINGDVNPELPEIFTVTLSNVTGSAVLVAATVTGTIINGMNDTGIDRCAVDDSNDLSCPQVNFSGQDAERGRDDILAATAEVQTKQGGGRAGFDYTKMDATGQPIVTQTDAFNVTPWACVRDNVTGLWWEVKATDGGLRDKSQTFTWSSAVAYPTSVNEVGLCGFNDWRFPDRKELTSLLDYSVPKFSPTIDTAYFPQVSNGDLFWTETPSAANALNAWYIKFFNGVSGVFPKSNSINFRARLVRGRR